MDENRGASTPFLYAHGWTEVVAGTAPGAGAEFALTNPGRLGWQIVGVAFRLVTDANVANRYPRVDYDDGSGLIYSRSGFAQAVTAGTTADFDFQAGRGSSDWNANNEAYLPLQPAFLSPGHILRIRVANIQAGDVLSRIALMMERFPDVPGSFDPTLRRG